MQSALIVIILRFLKLIQTDQNRGTPSPNSGATELCPSCTSSARYREGYSHSPSSNMFSCPLQCRSDVCTCPNGFSCFGLGGPCSAAGSGVHRPAAPVLTLHLTHFFSARLRLFLDVEHLPCGLNPPARTQTSRVVGAARGRGVIRGLLNKADVTFFSYRLQACSSSSSSSSCCCCCCCWVHVARKSEVSRVHPAC